MERNHGRPAARLLGQQRQKLHPGVPEEDVQQRATVGVQLRAQPAGFVAAQKQGPSEKLAFDNPPQPAPGAFWHDNQLLERKLGLVLALLREHHHPETVDGGNLPEDVLHLRLEKRRTVARDSATTIHESLKLDGVQLDALRTLGGIIHIVACHVLTVAVLGGG